MPKVLGPRVFGNSMPRYAYDWSDLLAQEEADQEQKDLAHRDQNRTRLRPSSIEIMRMEQSISWPARYLAQFPQLVRTVQAVAVAKMRDRDVEDAARKLRLPGRVVRRWHGEGCDLIAKGLVRDKIRVF
jgi:hypothetical protein